MTVKWTQAMLTALAEQTGNNAMDPGEVDGEWGPKTMQAVKVFQKAYGIQVDGYPGPQTDKAMRDAAAFGMPAIVEDDDIIIPDNTEEKQVSSGGADQYLQADGRYHIPRGVQVQLSDHLWANEIHCQGYGCCSESVISKRIIDLFEEIRNDIGEPLAIGTAGGSGYRCPKHNTDPDVKGASGSLHLISDAVDIHYRDPAKLKRVVLQHLKDGEVGLYSWGCHVGRWDKGYVSEFNGGS